MKKIFIFLIVIFSLTIFSNNLFIFKNIGIISQEYPWTDELNISLDPEENLVFIENAEYYKVQIANLENITFKIIGTIDDLKNTLSSRVNIINTNPIILKDFFNPNYIYFYNNSLKSWCKTDSEKLSILLNNKVLYAKNIKGLVLTSKPLKWDLFYNLKTNGDLFVTYKIYGKIKDSYNTFLINENFDLNQPLKDNRLYTSKSFALETSPSIPQIVNESAIIDMGEIKTFDGEFSKVIKLGSIKKYEDINYLEINFYSRSFNNKYLSIIREFENTKENGLGIPLIPGKIYLFSKKDNIEYLNKVSNISKTAVNSKGEFYIGESWNSFSNLEILNEIKTKNYVEKTFKFNVTSPGKTRITITGQAMKLLNIKGNYINKFENSDKISVYINGNQEIVLTIRSYINY
ncbi:hypothetical protein SAMN02745164_00976 [Marinitoga hydrogenitolerans DSM 16785]|uniref:Uncharacterized protein n=1 Tax=Marinitoga hydrogenitolerans (strain DSM 16785 / JCM 12826 / AT1271) TaxID=1122195 RepID=A0A1M4VPU5_MARH1|nr:hypothetical protein [Marinitoga hydrogenitolerans]SHE70812.1 hypothetical protein SAMN02745164_00976 [Marinitoga hydrogenitolerans DSM 16785]